ncbi:dihydrofolate reductase [Paenibacillus jamilae]|jgi:dihydrofolate reductase|uniref:dihydrofolate reductase family protein n=1 Tax=Paenibacillus TaxID=44249 RepID=UPI00042E3660|nr:MULTISPECIES: dihydrofolate reductase family protein [Paenibacillus]AHM64228.1 bifunctional deaminase-reductase domain-containing protein [Paenibacillus polymyxa SQR-21]AIY09906.1 deaminase [Paenibacillus polymyxa]AUS24773.1 bifunctional deaminase-reductase domain-containing protein [Paenibacillus polymyxa]KJK29026.1 deaminase [Paenibacillus polymyxa]MBY0025003.1 dihydrofolate reductase [Paenibacillus polymyxa]
MDAIKSNKVVLYIAVSLDGYIALPDGSVDWLFDVKGDGGDNGYADFYDTVGTVLMGRLTYEEVLKLSDDFPYAGKPCYILTRSLAKHEQAPHVTFTDEDLSELVPRLQKQSEGLVWLVGGGQLVQAFMQAGLLEKAIIAIIPKVLGQGIPLFPEGTLPSTFELQEIERRGDIVLLYYNV